MRAVVLAALMCAGCNERQQTARADDRICLTPPEQTQGAWGSCLHRWAYRLARGPDSSRDIAEAVVTACADAVAFQVNAAAPNERVQLLADINRSAPGIAFYHVVQARAGHCDIP